MSSGSPHKKSTAPISLSSTTYKPTMSSTPEEMILSPTQSPYPAKTSLLSSYKISWTPLSLSTLFTTLSTKSSKISRTNIPKQSAFIFSVNISEDSGPEKKSARKESNWVFTTPPITSSWCSTFDCLEKIWLLHGSKSLRFQKLFKTISNTSPFMPKGPTIKFKRFPLSSIQPFLNFWVLTN
jgi:hypothetical protein